jgi:hypothetical protein
MGSRKCLTSSCVGMILILLVFYFVNTSSVFAQKTFSDTTLNIGSRRELFVDEFLIAERKELELQLHLPVPKEVVMIFNKPWEGSGSDFEVVLRDGSLFRMYYTTAQLTNSDVSNLTGKRIHIRMVLREADLYSLKFQE